MARPGPAERGRLRFHRRTRTRCPKRPRELGARRSERELTDQSDDTPGQRQHQGQRGAEGPGSGLADNGDWPPLPRSGPVCRGACRPQRNGPRYQATPARPTPCTSPAGPPTRSQARLTAPPDRALAVLRGRPAAPRAAGAACRLYIPFFSVAAVGARRILPHPGSGMRDTPPSTPPCDLCASRSTTLPPGSSAYYEVRSGSLRNLPDAASALGVWGHGCASRGACVVSLIRDLVGEGLNAGAIP